MKSTNQIDKSEINELVELTGQGDWEAFKKLKDKMYPILFKFLRRYCFDDELIKDIISSTFCIIIEKSNKKMLYLNCLSWIISIAKNQMINHIRKYKNIVYSDKLDSISYENNLIKHLSVKQALDNLDFKSRQFIYLLYYEKVKHKEISKIMKISKSTIQRRNKEILLYLKEQISDEENTR